jgi:cupin fold WbuC family metalloprotein
MQLIDNALFRALCAEAEDAPRRRAHHLLHDSRDEPVQRMLIAAQPGTYFRPHRHLTPPKWELLLVLKGAADWLGFDDGGTVTGRIKAGAHKPAKGLEAPPGAWHALVCLAPDTVLLECKPGPAAPVAERDLAPWSPPEGSGAAADYVRWMVKAEPGQRFAPPG